MGCGILLQRTHLCLYLVDFLSLWQNCQYCQRKHKKRKKIDFSGEKLEENKQKRVWDEACSKQQQKGRLLQIFTTIPNRMDQFWKNFGGRINGSIGYLFAFFGIIDANAFLAFNYFKESSLKTVNSQFSYFCFSFATYQYR